MPQKESKFLMVVSFQLSTSSRLGYLNLPINYFLVHDNNNEDFLKDSLSPENNKNSF
jgi:hypothetical protein